jgi:hypothetical protein
MSVYQGVDRARAGLTANRLLVSGCQVMNIEHFPRTGTFGKTRQPSFFLGHAHILVDASARMLVLECHPPALIVSHVGPVHRTQRFARQLGARRLRHAFLTHHYHLHS